MSAERLQAGLSALDLVMPSSDQARLLNYISLIKKWNNVYNLTAIRDPERMLIEHLLDSLSILPYLRPARILDIGSGAGLPGIPLAIARPECHVTLLDSNHKKCAFMQQAVIELSLPNVAVVCERVEASTARERFDTVVSRAFSDTGHFARVGSTLLAPGGVMLAMKGLNPHEEIAQLPATVKLQRVEPLTVPGLAAQRHVVIMTEA